jgi:hypothetical protein
VLSARLIMMLAIGALLVVSGIFDIGRRRRDGGDEPL